jgi:signal transduction histidine kinase
MQTIRGRIAVWYALALGSTIIVFGSIVYAFERRGSLAELDNLLELEAALIAAILQEASGSRPELVLRDTESGRRVLAPDVAVLLDGAPGYLAVLGDEGDLYLSQVWRTHPFTAVMGSPDSVSSGFATLPLASGTLRQYAVQVTDAGPYIRTVVVAAPVASFALRPERLLSSMALTAPFVIMASWFIGYFLVGRTLKPVDRIVDEVEAISDGRSLHRRLATPYEGGELARLSITLNQMLGRLERSFVTLRRFTADASHELKTPLTVLRTGIEQSITHPDVPRDVMATLEEILLEVNRMTEMMDSLLMLARADEGRAPLHLEELDFKELLSELSETASILAEHSAVDVRVAVPAERIVIQADRGRVRQLVMNLLTNAVKYTLPGGEVAVSCEVEHGTLILRVRDSGIGIAAGDLLHIYDRFWRADPARSRTGARPGAGLGLAISKWIAEAHGGSIDVQSRPEKGTTFTVRLPLTLEDGVENGRDDVS